MAIQLIIVPTYNERDSIEVLVEHIFKYCPEAHVLFVDDNSPDGTGPLADTMSENDQRVHVLHRTEKKGLGRAYIAGFKWALEREYELIFEMDADFSHHPNDLPALLTGAVNADLVLGSRYLGGIRIINWPLNRLILSRGAGIYVKTITGMPFTDPTGGFKCFRRELLQFIDLDSVRSNGYSFQVEMTHIAWRNGYRVAEVPITFEERREGQSKMSGAIIREAFWMTWKLLFQNGMRRKPRKERTA